MVMLQDNKYLLNQNEDFITCVALQRTWNKSCLHFAPSRKSSKIWLATRHNPCDRFVFSQCPNSEQARCTQCTTLMDFKQAAFLVDCKNEANNKKVRCKPEEWTKKIVWICGYNSDWTQMLLQTRRWFEMRPLIVQILSKSFLYNSSTKTCRL